MAFATAIWFETDLQFVTGLGRPFETAFVYRMQTASAYGTGWHFHSRSVTVFAFDSSTVFESMFRIAKTSAFGWPNA
jgi:hypothetical protein